MNVIHNRSARTPENGPTHIVGVGASAGGLDALEQFFGAMPEDTGMAFVVVQHLSPDFKSMMDELLARRTKLPVLLVEDGMPVEPNRIYLIPAKKEMIISGGRLLLSDKAVSPGLTLPIDIFLSSLAEDVGQRAVGVILSGAGSDGSQGIRDVHEAGGLALCQDPESADFDGMPKSALDTGNIDHVLSPSQMPAVLLEHARRPDVSRSPHNAERPHGLGAALNFLQEVYGIDFSDYKPSTVLRRIERRLQATQAPALEAYVERLAHDSAELDVLFRDLLIGVTRFFRDREAFNVLDSQVLPDLLERTKSNEEFRVWIAGCATGEEAYSVGILLLEQLRKKSERRRIRILATDIHPGSLDFASRGLYESGKLAELEPELRERYFQKLGPNYQVAPELRQLVVFAPHNVVKDAPFTRLDFISCRNLLIYLQPPAQKKVLSLFRFALKRNGVLFLGPSESAGALVDDFESIDAHWRIYKKQRDFRLPRDLRFNSPRVAAMHASHVDVPQNASGYSLPNIVGVYDALLTELMPPSLLVNERRELVHAFAGASRYLKMRDGRPSADLLELVVPDLRAAITGAMQRVFKDNKTVTFGGLRFALGGEERAHRLVVKPVAVPGTSLKHVLVVIEELDVPLPSKAGEAELDVAQVSRDEVDSLGAELRRTKENLQATIEELETSNEELQAANEELLASNEELQSTNEELQSVNEELYSVNSEYQKKIAELTELTNDMDNLLASIQVGTIFLDRQLCIRKFTPLVAEAFNLLPQDIARPIAGFTTNLNHERLVEDLNEALQLERPIEREVCDRSGNWFFLRILPYRARGTVDGVVLTLIDINGLKAAEDAMFRERYLLNGLMDSVPDIIYFKDSRGRFVRVNKAMAEWLGIDNPAQASGKAAADFLPARQARKFELLDKPALAGKTQSYRQEQYSSEDGKTTWFMTTRQPLLSRDGKPVGMLGVARDVTDQKQAEDGIRLAVTRRDEFLAMLSHELRNPLAAIVNAATLLVHLDGIAPSGSEALGVIHRQSRQMARLLDDLLEVSRVTQNKIELRKQLIDARGVVSEAIAITHERFRARQVKLDVELDDEPVMVNADPARLQQIVVNLLDNASKYSQKGGQARVELERDREQAVFKISDNGTGIDRALLDNIFQPFVQGKATLDRTEGGMGVGLTLVRSLVEMHGGSVVAKSDGIGRGSEFVMRMPIAPTMADIDIVPGGRRSLLTWPDAKRIVLIEDNADSCQMLKLLLERAGYEVLTASDGKSGLDLIEQAEPEIAIVDIGLPQMNGFDVARHLRAQAKYQNLYMVALTGYGQTSDHAVALEAGFDEHLVKPLHPEELERLMRSRTPVN